MNTLSAAAASQFRQAQALFAQGRAPEAAVACKALCEQFPRFPGGWHLASAVALRLGRLDKALEFIDRALALSPGESVLGLHRARVLLLQGQTALALALASDIERLHAREPAAQVELAGFFSLCNEHARALPYYQQLSRQAPERAQNWFNLASTERFVGHIEAAEAAYDRGLRLAPQNYEAYYVRAGLRKQTAERNHVAELEQRRAATAEWNGQWQIDYALAKEYEDLGEDTRAFAALQRGASLRRAHMNYQVQDDVIAMQAIAAAYPSASTDTPGHDSAEPIFVLGLPRTGTTLAERILGSHSQVFAAGELNHFASEMTRALQARSAGRALGKLDAIAASPDLDFAALGRAYVAATRPATGHRPRFVDKMPLNFLYVGLIARALPQARIIELLRHPLDTCYAMYKQMFTMAYPFSYDLQDLAAYFCAYRRLMAHWHRILPGRVLRLRYEDLVEDQAGQTRRLLEHCGLPWEDACLSFERNTQASTTASAVQVREKLYRSSLGKWQRYTTELNPLIEALRADPDGRAALEEYAA